MDWKPIADMPEELKDGRDVLLYRKVEGRHRMRVDWWRDGREGQGFVGWGEFNTALCSKHTYAADGHA